MPFCIRCSTFNCGVNGLTSVSITPNSSVRAVDDEICNPTLSGIYIPGPGTVSVQINAWAFTTGTDRWLNSRGKGQAQASQTNIMRYNFKDDKYWFIPTKSHRAQIAGCIGNCSLDQVMFSGSQADMQTANGASLTTELGVIIGAGFHYTGAPQEISIPDLKSWQLDMGSGAQVGYLESFTASVDFPNPATVSYSFSFPIDNS